MPEENPPLFENLAELIRVKAMEVAAADKDKKAAPSDQLELLTKLAVSSSYISQGELVVVAEAVTTAYELLERENDVSIALKGTLNRRGKTLREASGKPGEDSV